MCVRPFLFFPLSQDAYALGEVFIGSKENSYTVLSGLPPSTQGYHWNHGITIVTPDRKFLFACETEAEQRDWIAAFQRVINRPMRPQEYAGGGEKFFLDLLKCIWKCTVWLLYLFLQWKHISNTNPEAYRKPQLSRLWWEVPDERSWDGFSISRQTQVYLYVQNLNFHLDLSPVVAWIITDQRLKGRWCHHYAPTTLSVMHYHPCGLFP